MKRRWWLWIGLPALLLGACGAWVLADWWFCLPAEARAEYVGRDECQRCHEKEMKLWTGSDHDKAMDHAWPDTVLADFNNTEFTNYGVTSKFSRRGDEFFALTDGPDGALQEFKIDYVFGVYPLQQYLVTFPQGRVQCLPIAWDVPNKRWFHLYPGELIRHDDILHWTKPLQNWNYMCADCHSTNLRRNFDLKTETYHTTWSEIDVSCETCHGPGSLHVKLADKKWFFWDRQRGMALPQLKSADHRVEIETCAPCHARRRIVADGGAGGARFMDHYLPELMDTALYYPDGQILEEDYEYGSFTQSKMYHNAVRCSDCHNPHSLYVNFSKIDAETGRARVVDNRACGGANGQCHLLSKYDTPQHDHHPKREQPGALCVDCHMPITPYMVVDPRRDHSLRIPRPQLTVDLGIPNACNRCHNDPAKGETAKWAVEKVEQWYGKKTEPQQFAYAIAAGRQGELRGEKLLDAVVRRKELSAMVRSSALSLLVQYPEGWSAATHNLNDAEPLVRATAVRAMEMAGPDECFRHLRRALTDPLRAVRTEAARILVAVPTSEFQPAERRAFDLALQEYIDGQGAMNDQPGAHVALAMVYERQDKADRAEGEYRTALRLDPEFVPARVNLAMLFSATGRREAAIAAFRETVALAERRLATALDIAKQLPAVRKKLAEAPHGSATLGTLEAQVRALEARGDEARDLERLLGRSHYSMGLLWAEEEKSLGQAERELATAARLLPLDPRIRYNHGLALAKLGRAEAAEHELKNAYALVPNEPDFAVGLATFYRDQQRWADALPYAEQLVRLRPSDAGWRQLLQDVQQHLK